MFYDLLIGAHCWGHSVYD